MSEESVKPLYYWPAHADLTILKEAFQELRPPFQVKPYPWQVGHPGRVIVLSSHFPYVFDHAIVSSKETGVSALRWALGLQNFDKGPKLLENNLKEIFGEGVKEIKNDS
jgi:hypothetical protein